MKTFIFLALTLVTLSTSAFSQAADETIEADPATGFEGIGGVVFIQPGRGKPGIGGGGAGGSVDSGSDATLTLEIVNQTVDEKTRQDKNKKEKEKAKKDNNFGKIVRETGIQLSKVWKDTLAALAKISLGVSYIETHSKPEFNDNGEVGTATSCEGLAIDLNLGGSRGKNPCTEVNQSVQQIILPSGQRVNMINVYYRVVNYCYVTGKCPETTIQFTVKDEAELQAIFAEIAAG